MPAVIDIFDDRRHRLPQRRPPTTQSPQIAPISNRKKTGGPPPFSCGIDYFTRRVLPAASPAPRFFTNNHAQLATPPKSAGARQSQHDLCRTNSFYCNVHAFFRGLMAAAAGSIAGFAFLLPPPATGSSNERWRRSAVGLARLSLADAEPVTGISWDKIAEHERQLPPFG